MIISLDAILAVFLSFAVTAVICPLLIPFLIRLKVGQTERVEGVQSHLKKAGTPTMGGIAILVSVILTSLVFARRYPRVLPVLFLTAKSQEQDKVEAYSEGGDDYLVKPFSQTELLMKVKSLLRRYTEYQKPQAGQTPSFGGNIRLDGKRRCAIKGDKRIPLTDKEYAIMHFFVEHRGEIVGNKELYEGVWNDSYLPSDGNTVMVHILNLRKKLEEDANHPQIIKTIWGKGYTVE